MNYLLDENGNPELCTDLSRWSREFTKDRVVANDVVGGAHVHTVFMGVDMGHGKYREPLLYATHVIIKGGCEAIRRYASVLEALAGHGVQVEILKRELARKVGHELHP